MNLALTDLSLCLAFLSVSGLLLGRRTALALPTRSLFVPVAALLAGIGLGHGGRALANLAFGGGLDLPAGVAMSAGAWAVVLLLLRGRSRPATGGDPLGPDWARLRLLEAAVSATRDGVIIAEAEPDVETGGLRVRYANPAFEELTGYTHEEAVGRSPTVLCPVGPTDNAPHPLNLTGGEPNPALAAVRAALRGTTATRLDVPGRRKDGSPVWTEWCIVPVADAGGRFTHRVAVLRDTTERHRAQEEIRRARDFLTSLLDNIPVPVHVADPADRYRLVNPAWERAFGVSRARAIGQTPAQLLPADAAKVWQGHAVVARTNLEVVRGELVVRGGEGDRVFWSVTFPLPGPGGQPGVTGGVAVELTELREAETAVRRSEENYRTLFESSPHPMWVIDPDSRRFLAVNAAAVQLYGYPRDEFLRVPPSALCPDGDTPDGSNVVPVGSVHRHVGGRLRQRHRTKDGQPIDVEVAAHPIRYDGGFAQLVMAIDVTERRKLEEQLRQSQKMEAVGRLAGGVAHDFNNLLTVINGNAELVRNLPPDDADAVPLIDDIREAGDRAAGLVRQLLTFSRRQPARAEVIDLGRVVAGLLGMLRRLLGPSVSIQFDPPPDPVAVLADRGQLEQVVVNLAVNARDAMPDGGTLRLVVGLKDGMARLVVCDTGCGMTAEVRRRIFEPFFTTKGPDKGTGLGLATVYGIVQQAGGTIEVESAVGRGSTFRITLPACDVPHPLAQTPAPALTATPAPGQAGRAGSVLLVEDEKGVRSLAAAILRSGGYEVREAADGPAALGLIEAGDAPAVLVTDLRMPGIGGRELAARVRSVRPEVGVVFTSGYAPEGDEMAAEAGAVYVPKPFSPATLLRAVGTALSGQRIVSMPAG